MITKRKVIALAIFLLLGLSVFTFANPGAINPGDTLVRELDTEHDEGLVIADHLGSTPVFRNLVAEDTTNQTPDNNQTTNDEESEEPEEPGMGGDAPYYPEDPELVTYTVTFKDVNGYNVVHTQDVLENNTIDWNHPEKPNTSDYAAWGLTEEYEFTNYWLIYNSEEETWEYYLPFDEEYIVTGDIILKPGIQLIEDEDPEEETLLDPTIQEIDSIIPSNNRYYIETI